MNKQRIGQIALQVAKLEFACQYTGLPMSEVKIRRYAIALAESPEYLQAILPDGVEAVGYVFKDETTRNFYNSRIGTANEYGKFGVAIYDASAILAATAPLKAEIERLKKLSTTEACCEIPAVGEYIAQVEEQLTTEQSNVKVLTDALKEIKLRAVSLADAQVIALEALANVRGK